MLGVAAPLVGAIALVKAQFPGNRSLGIDQGLGELLEGGVVVGGESVGEAEVEPGFEADRCGAGGGLRVLGKGLGDRPKPGGIEF